MTLQLMLSLDQPGPLARKTDPRTSREARPDFRGGQRAALLALHALGEADDDAIYDTARRMGLPVRPDSLKRRRHELERLGLVDRHDRPGARRLTFTLTDAGRVAAERTRNG